MQENRPHDPSEQRADSDTERVRVDSSAEPPAEVEGHAYRRSPAEAPAEVPTEVEDHGFRFRSPAEPQSDVEGHELRSESPPEPLAEGDAAGEESPEPDVEGHGPKRNLWESPEARR